ncbi:MAG TPA: acetyl-CoA hydrolase/transferase C-terminal domain-containing protein [Syntrophomonadaceae bacterium]|nr:acetyl-CoA hydrolase/transferase C-terminal domain-containing protein [Syntrophomonadaceae bacterium]
MLTIDDYKAKLVTADEAVKVIKSGDLIHYGQFAGVIHDLDIALAKRAEELHDVRIINAIWPYKNKPAVVQADPEGQHFKWQSTQFSGVERHLNQEGLCWYIPVQFREQPVYYERDIKPDVAMLQVTPMDKFGYFNFGPQVSDSQSIIANSKKVIVEVNENMPKCYGIGNTVHISDVDYIVHGSNPELAELIAKDANEVDKKIAEFIVERINNQSTLQLGIGGLPNYCGKLIAESDLKDLSVHSEMFPDACLNLYEAGKITGNKNLNKGKMVWTFAMGSQRVYDFVDNNPVHLACPVDYVNGIHTIAAIDNFVSVCSCLEVDLFGQVNSESVGLQHIGGNGGQLDFVLGSYLSKGGQSFLCTPSVHVDRKGNRSSMIKPTLPEGSIVTIPRQVTQYVVTEYGVANMKGKSTWERAEALINIAHPDFKDELVKGAERMGIWKNSSKVMK